MEYTGEVAPLAGAWIEILPASVFPSSFRLSPPSRGRGLKYVDAVTDPETGEVAPLAGAWIEI